jgi:hypothetical protein
MPADEKSHAETPALHVLGASVRHTREGVRLFARTECGCAPLLLSSQLAREVGRELMGLPANPARFAQPRTPAAKAPRAKPGARIPAYRQIFAARQADPSLNLTALCRELGVRPEGYYTWHNYQLRKAQQPVPEIAALRPAAGGEQA